MNDCDCVDDQPKVEPQLQPWVGPPVIGLATGEILQHADGTAAIVDVVPSRHGTEIWLCHCTTDLAELTGGMIQLFSAEDLLGWHIVEQQMIGIAPITDVGFDQAATAPMLIQPGSRVVADDSLTELVVVASDWGDDEASDTVLAHPHGDPSALKRYKANNVTVL